LRIEIIINPVKILLIYPSNPYYNSEQIPILSMDHFCIKANRFENFLIRFYSKYLLDRKIKLNCKPLLYPHVALLSLRNLSFPHRVSFHDDYIDFITQRHLQKFSEYDLIGINVLTQSAKRGYQLYDILKPLKIPIVFGGPHVTAMPEEAKDHCDILCLGPAESYWEDLLNDVEKKQAKKIYYSQYKLSMIHKFRYYSYGYEEFDSFGYLPVTIPVYSRGCNNRCSFCFIPDFVPHWHSRSIDELTEDIIKAGNKQVFFSDANIAPNKKTLRIFLKILKKLKKNNIYWASNISLNLFDEDTPYLLKESNCNHVNIGIESLTMLEQKISSLKFAEDTINKLHEVGITIKGCFILGYPGDTEKSFEAIKKFIINNGLDFFDLASLVPYPGTRLYNYFKNNNMLKTLDYDHYIIESNKLVTNHPLENYPYLFDRLISHLYNLKNMFIRFKNNHLSKKKIYVIFYIFFINIINYFSVKIYRNRYAKKKHAIK
jgi:radical SAM superfamily enzyme YgiQ (UPF0313 family)